MMATRTRTIETYQNGVLVNSRTETYEVSTEQVNDETIRAQALSALAANKTFVALATPSTAQNAAQIKALSRQVNGVIRLLLQQLDATD